MFVWADPPSLQQDHHWLTRMILRIRVVPYTLSGSIHVAGLVYVASKKFSVRSFVRACEFVVGI